MKIKVLALTLAILAFFLFVGSPFQQAAKAVALIDDAVIAILIAAIAACGITFVTTGGFDNTREYVRNYFTQFLNENYYNMNEINYGRNSTGKLLLNNRFVLIISAFISWLKVELGLVDNSYLSIEQQASYIGNLQITRLPIAFVRALSNKTREWLIEESRTDQPVYIVESNTGQYILIGTTDSLVTVTYTEYSLLGVVQTQQRRTFELVQEDATYNGDRYNPTENYYYYNLYAFDGPISTATTSKPLYKYRGSEIANAITNGRISNYEGLWIVSGEIVPPLEDQDYSSGDGAILDVGASWGDSLGDIIDEVIPGEFSYENEATTEMTYETEEEVTEQIDETPSDTISQEVNDYQVDGLMSVFPFCIPFDIYNFFDCLAAEPVAPSFEWRFYVPGICDETIELDLSDFDTVAQIVRTMELLAFIVGLAFVTRDKMIKG